MIARFITGIGTGIETSTVPMYQSELCEASKRGRIVSSEPLFVGVGIVISYWFDYGMSFTSGSKAWRVPIACQMVFAFVVIFLVFGLPESPRYLYKMGRNEEALQVLCDVYDGKPGDEKIVREQDDVLEALETEQKAGEYKWSQLLKRDEVQTGKRVLLAYGMQFMNQMGGINLVVYYVTSVLQENVGLSRNLSLLLGGVIQIMFPIGSVRVIFQRHSASLMIDDLSLASANLFSRSNGSSQSHDDRLFCPCYLHDDGLDSPKHSRPQYGKWCCGVLLRGMRASHHSYRERYTNQRTSTCLSSGVLRIVSRGFTFPKFFLCMPELKVSLLVFPQTGYGTSLSL